MTSFKLLEFDFELMYAGYHQHNSTQQLISPLSYTQHINRQELRTGTASSYCTQQLISE